MYNFVKKKKNCGGGGLIAHRFRRLQCMLHFLFDKSFFFFYFEQGFVIIIIESDLAFY